MASITIRNLDDEVKRRLRIRAAEHGRSVEDEVRTILKEVTASPAQSEEQTPRTGAELWDAIRRIVEPLGGIELEIPPRGPMREPPDFSR
jgi:plasmid stability protein